MQKNNIKLVYIISDLGIGGAQILLLDIINELKTYNLFEINVITINSGEYIETYRNHGINVIDLKEKLFINPFIYFRLKKILKKLRPQIVHTHLHKADFYGRLAAKSCKIPFIYSTCHNYSTNHKRANIKRKTFFDIVDNFVINYTRSELFAISELVKTYLIARNKKFSEITEVIYNGVNIEKEKFISDNAQIRKLRVKNRIGENDFVISIIGRLDRQKGHLFFLKSVKSFINENDNVKVLIIGKGSLINEINEFIKENFAANKIILKGFELDTEKFIELSDMICVPSFWEGFGLVIIEGMIKKKIILASDAGGIPEIIKNNKTGFLFKSGEEEDLLRNVKFVFANRNKLDHIKNEALIMVKDKFNIKKNTGKYFLAYTSKVSKDQDTGF